MPTFDPIYLREKDVTRRYAVGRSWFRELIADGLLPKPKRFGSRMSVWSLEELDSAFANPELPRLIAERNKKRRGARKAVA